jgi:outer membrane protein, multidrug efflux system
LRTPVPTRWVHRSVGSLTFLEDAKSARCSAQTDLYNASQVLVIARRQRLRNLVDLYRALGGGWLERTGEPPPPGNIQ